MSNLIHQIYRFFHPLVIGIHPEYKSQKAFIQSIPERVKQNEGTVIYKGRNEIRKIKHEGQSYVIKSFCRPHWINKFVYGIFRGSKAKRSFLYANRFLEIGVGSPQPVAYIDERNGLLFGRSYYVSLLSECPYTYAALFEQEFDYADEVLRTIGKMTAILHNHGYAHKDYGRGNILFGKKSDGTVLVEIVDLNRLHIGTIDIKQGCKNLERLPATPHMHRLIAEEYAKLRGFDFETCYELIRAYRKAELGNEVY